MKKMGSAATTRVSKPRRHRGKRIVEQMALELTLFDFWKPASGVWLSFENSPAAEYANVLVQYSQGY